MEVLRVVTFFIKINASRKYHSMITIERILLSIFMLRMIDASEFTYGFGHGDTFLQ